MNSDHVKKGMQQEMCIRDRKWKAQAIQFKVKYAEGTLSAKAYDEDGKEITDTPVSYTHLPPKKYFRMYPGNEVRLMNAYFVKCTDYITDENGKVTEIHCTYDPETKSGSGFTGRKVKGTIHWVCADECVDAEVRLYENIVDEEKGVYNEDGSLNLNPNSLTILPECKLEAGLKDSKAYDSFQFVRQGYFCCDAKDSTEDHLVFNRIVSLKSSYKPKK